jgi:Transposase DDE domain group 1
MISAVDWRATRRSRYSGTSRGPYCPVQLHALAYNLANLICTPAMPKTAEWWSLTSLGEKLIKIGPKVTSHGRYVTFQMAEVAVSRQMFADILSLITRLRAPPAPA